MVSISNRIKGTYSFLKSDTYMENTPIANMENSPITNRSKAPMEWHLSALVHS